MTSEPAGINRRNIFIFVGLAVALLAAGIGYLVFASGQADADLAAREARAQAAVEEFEQNRPDPTPAPPRPTVEEEAEPVPTGPLPEAGEVVVVHRVPGEDYGRLAIRHADGTRTLLERTCRRAHIAAGKGLCVSDNDAIAPAFITTLFDATDPRFPEIKSYGSALPSRVRVSPDGSLTTVTAFVSGLSYEDIGGGDTTTVVTIDRFLPGNQLRGANQFKITGTTDDHYLDSDRQYWGLTFAENNDDFFITGFFGTEPEIMFGSLEDLTVSPLGVDGSCPSLSPDGNTLVYKQSRPDGGFDLVARDVSTGATWPLGETRSIDDQVEWLDDDTILYAIHPEGGDNPVQPVWDIWSLDIAEGSEPELFLPNADSPAVIR